MPRGGGEASIRNRSLRWDLIVALRRVLNNGVVYVLTSLCEISILSSIAVSIGRNLGSFGS